VIAVILNSKFDHHFLSLHRTCTTQIEITNHSHHVSHPNLGVSKCHDSEVDQNFNKQRLSHKDWQTEGRQTIPRE
jgi:hypothetical protein